MGTRSSKYTELLNIAASHEHQLKDIGDRIRDIEELNEVIQDSLLELSENIKITTETITMIMQRLKDE